MIPSSSNDPNYLHLIVTLDCGTKIEVTQPHRGMNLNLTFTPKSGITVSDFADLKDGKLNIRVTEESLVGLYQALRLLIEGQTKRSLLERLFKI